MGEDRRRVRGGAEEGVREETEGFPEGAQGQVGDSVLVKIGCLFQGVPEESILGHQCS